MAVYDITGKPIKTNKKPTKKTTKNNIGKKVLGTAGTLATEAGRGFLGTTEGISDLALYGASGISKLAGNELLSTSFKQAAKENTTDKWLKTAEKTYRPNTITKKGDLAETIASGLGQVGAVVGGSRVLPKGMASIKAGKLSVPTISLATGTGSGMSQAYQRGASDLEATAYGVGRGSVEGITEGLFGGLGKTFTRLTGGSALDDAIVNRLTKNITNKFTKNLASVGIKSAGEGVEEVLASLVDPLLQKATYEKNIALKQLYKNTNLLEDFVVGALISGIVQTPSLITDNGRLDIAPQTRQEVESQLQTNKPDFLSNNLDQSEGLGLDKKSKEIDAGTLTTKTGEKIKIKSDEMNLSYPGQKRIVRTITATDLQGKPLSKINFWNKRLEDLEINDLIINEIKSDVKGKQYGTELLNNLIQNAKKSGIKRIVADNVSKEAQTYWEKQGFAKELDRDGDYTGNYTLNLQEQANIPTQPQTPAVVAENRQIELSVEKTQDKERNVFYHGTKKGNVFDKFDINKGDTGTGTNILNQGNQAYLTDDQDIANIFAKLAQDNDNLKQNKIPSATETGTVLEFGLGKNPKVKTVGYDLVKDPIITEKTLQEAKEQGYDAIKFEDKVWENWDGIGAEKVYNYIQQKGHLPYTIIPTSDNVNRIQTKAEKVEQPKTRKTVSTIATSETLVDDKKIQELLSKTDYQYSVQTNLKTVDEANTIIKNSGYDNALSQFNAKFDAGARIRPTDIALGERLIQEAKKKGDYNTVLDLVQKVATLGTELGQSTQALSIIRKLTPEGQLKVLTNQLDRLKLKNNNGEMKIKGIEKVEITPQMAEKVLKAKNEQELADAMDEVKQEIADQLPPTLRDKLNAWRYFAMLGNPKTHVRNIVGNFTMAVVTDVKNTVAKSIETAVNKVAPQVFENENRTKTFKKSSKEVMDLTKQTIEQLAKEQTATSKFADGDTILDKKKATNIKALQKLYDLVGDTLTIEDTIFRNVAFKDSFSQYLTANGIKTQQDIDNNPKLVEQAKQYATEQSMYAVFQQYSALASWLNTVKRKQYGWIADALIPFTKTPINIATTATRYSPAGLMFTMIKGLADVKSGKITATKFIDDLSKGLTGSAIMGIGVILAQMGILSGGEDDEKEGQYDKALGQQPYSLRIGNKTFTIDWLVPASMPLLMGAELYKTMQKGDFAVDGNAIVDTVTQTIDPMVSLSFLQGLNNALSGFDKNKIAGVFNESIKSYVGQFFPTIGGQIAKTIDPTIRTSGASQDSPWKLGEEIIRQNMQKLPGVSMLLEPATDLWGNEAKRSENVMQRAIENFLLPSMIQKDISKNTDKELKRLYSESGEDSVLPAVYLKKYVQYKGEKFETNAKQYTQYKKIYGQEAYAKLNDLFKTNTYKSASQEDKVKMVEQVYKYATDEAKKDFLSKKGIGYTNSTQDKVAVFKQNSIVDTINNDISLKEAKYKSQYPDKYNSVSLISDYNTYKTYKDKIDTLRENLKGQSTEKRKQSVFNEINKLPLTKLQKAMLFKQYYSSYDGADKSILDKINSLNLTSKEKLDIAEDYGFTIINGKVKL